MEIKVKRLAQFKSQLKQYRKQEKILLPIFHIILLLLAIYAMLPIVFVLLNSLKGVDDYYTNSLGFPKVMMWKNYANALKITYRNTSIFGMLFNTIIFVATYSVANIMASLFTAYALARFDFIGKKFIYALAVVIQIIPIFGSTGAAYILQTNLGLIDNRWLSWITALNGFDYAFLIFHSYLVGIDKSYSEAAEMDGASKLTIMFKIMVPMVIPSMMILWLSSLIGFWNNYTSPLIYWPNHPTLSTGLYNLKSLASYIEGGTTTYFAAVVIALIPVTLLFVGTQKWIFNIKVDGGLKG